MRRGPRHHGHHPHHPHRDRPAWWLARGVHRTVWGTLLVAALIGAGVGSAFTGAHFVHGAGGRHGSLICAGLAVAAMLWPLAWMATARIVWPLRALARAAGELRGGQLQSRSTLPEGPGEVGEVAGALRGMADRVAQQLQDQRALMAAVSHELRSPLGRVRVMVELARDEAAGALEGEGAGALVEGAGAGAAAGYFDAIQAEIDGMDRLVGDLLAAARIDFEAVSLQPLDPAGVAARALELARLPAGALRVEGEIGQIRADPTLLARALALVLDNARRYGAGQAGDLAVEGAGGAGIALRVAGGAGRVRFTVEDRGPGFAPGEEAQVFEPFYRGGAARAAGEGLGLALVRQIARAHGGEAGAANRAGGGAAVWLELPEAGEEQAEAGEEQAERAPGEGEQGQGAAG